EAPVGSPPPVIRSTTCEDCSAVVVVTAQVSEPAARFQKIAPVTTVLFDACPSLFQPEAVHVGAPSTENTPSSRSPAVMPAGIVIAWLVVSVVVVRPVERAATTGAATVYTYASDSVTVSVQVVPDAFVPSGSTLRLSIRPPVDALKTAHSFQAK